MLRFKWIRNYTIFRIFTCYVFKTLMIHINNIYIVRIFFAIAIRVNTFFRNVPKTQNVLKAYYIKIRNCAIFRILPRYVFSMLLVRYITYTIRIKNVSDFFIGLINTNIRDDQYHSDTQHQIMPYIRVEQHIPVYIHIFQH